MTTTPPPEQARSHAHPTSTTGASGRSAEDFHGGPSDPDSPPPGPWKRRRWIWFVLLAALVIAGVAYQRHRAHAENAQASGSPGGGGGAGGGRGGGGRGGAGPGGAGRAQLVVAASASTADVPVYLAGLGAVTPTDSVTVRSRIDGQLMRIAFTEGQLVKAGDLLAEIDPRPYQVQLEQAQGQLSRDEALLANAKVDFERYQVLFTQDSVAKQTLDTQAALVRQYEGLSKIDQAAVDSAKLNLVYSRVTSPVSGRVGLRQVDPGNIIHAADTNGIVVVNALQPISVLFSVPENRVPDILARLQAGEKLKTEAYDRARQQLLAQGTLLTLDNRIDPTTGTVRLKALFPNEDYKLFPQQFVNAQLLIETLHDATLVPTASIQHGVQGTFVYVINQNQTANVRPVTTGPALGENTVITQGIKPGEQVVIEGSDKLTDGAAVTTGGPPGGRAGGVGGTGAAGGTGESKGTGAAGGPGESGGGHRGGSRQGGGQ